MILEGGVLSGGSLFGFRPRVDRYVAVLAIGIGGLVGMYYFKTGAFLFEAGNLAVFLKLQWLR